VRSLKLQPQPRTNKAIPRRVSSTFQSVPSEQHLVPTGQSRWVIILYLVLTGTKLYTQSFTMTLSVVVGSSGSGKTTFLNDVQKKHHCTYIRQYHLLRPYISVSKIPNFDPTALPFWEIYEKEGVADSIKVGGTMAGEFTAGLSGGQRKLLLFELIRQRTKNQSELLIVLDEPFAGVTDDFVPFIVDRLNEMRKTHNILLVTNDHVATLTELADNTITVSAIDRTKVKVNSREEVDRELTILALAVGDPYAYETSNADLKFFLDTEVYSNQALVGIGVFTVFSYCLFLATFWDSDEDSSASVVIAGSIVAYFCINPYLLALVDWRNAMCEESEALLHSSKGMNKILKSFVTLSLIFVISLIEWGCIVACSNGLEDVNLWLGLLFDSASMTFPFICLGVFTHMPFQAVQILGSLPFLLMIFLSTTFSPGAGVPVIKELRYLFVRFYLWCTIPGVMDDMEGCPAEDINLLYLILSAFVGVFFFVLAKGFQACQKDAEKLKDDEKRKQIMEMEEAQLLQVELYGEKALRRLQHQNSSNSLKNMVHSSSGDPTEKASVVEEA
jgi:ABC-type lipoprotein export system ATPase subunit